MQHNTKTIQEIIKKLDTFREAKEWSDFMTSLTAIEKILTNEKKKIDIFTFPIIQLNKRLSQSLNPALPPGIHYKTIHIYSMLIGKLRIYLDHLGAADRAEFERSKTNAIFSSLLTGVFAFSQNLKIQTRSSYFALINDQILKINICLNDHIRNILLGLLCGLDEDIDFAKKTNKAICNFYEIVDKKCFWNHLWEIFLALPEQRIYISNFVLRNPKIIEVCKQESKQRCNDKSSIFGTNKDAVKDGYCNKTMFYFLKEEFLIASLRSGLKSKDQIVQRGTLDILKNLFDYDDFNETSVLELMFDFTHIYSTRDGGLIKRIETFIDKDGHYLKIVDGFDDAFKINVEPNETVTPYLTLIEGMKARMCNGREDLLIYLKAMIYIEEKGDFNDYFENKLFIITLYELYRQKDQKENSTIIEKFDILLTQMETWSIAFLLYNHANDAFKDKIGAYYNINQFIEVLMYFFQNTKIMKDKNYMVHFSALVLLILQNFEKVDFNVLRTFILYSINYLPQIVSDEKMTIEQAYSLMIDYYNLEHDVNITNVYNNTRSIFASEFSLHLEKNENLSGKLGIFHAMILYFGESILSGPLIKTIYSQLCNYLENYTFDAFLVDTAHEIFMYVDKEIIEKFISDKGRKLYTLLLCTQYFESLYTFNLLFDRYYEKLIVDDFLESQNVTEIYLFLQYVLNQKPLPYFYNVFLVIIMHRKSMTANLEYKTESYGIEIDKYRNFISGINQQKNICKFAFDLIINANINHHGFEYIYEVKIEQLLGGIEIFCHLICNSAIFVDFLTYKTSKISLDGMPDELRGNTYRVFLYKIILSIFCINNYQIQLEAINLINLLIDKGIIDSYIITQNYEPKIMPFLEQMKFQNILLRCYTIIIALFNSENDVIQNNILGLFKIFDFKTQTAQEHLCSIYRFIDCPVKLRILMHIMAESKCIFIKYQIYKYLKNKVELCDSIQLHSVVSELVEKIIQEFEQADLHKPVNNNMSNNIKNIELYHKIIRHLLNDNQSMFLDCLLSKHKNCRFFSLTNEKLKIYDLLYKRLSLLTIRFLLIYEANLTDHEIMNTFNQNYQLIYNFYINKRNKLNLTDYFVWLNKKVKINEDLTNCYYDFMSKNFEMMNGVLTKYSDYSAKNISVEERHVVIIKLLKSICTVIPSYKADKYKLGLQNYFTNLFYALKSNNLEQRVTALECFVYICFDTSLHKYWKKEFVDYMMEPSFFKCTREVFVYQLKLTKAIFVNDPYKIGVLIDKFRVSGFFISKDIELSQRIRVLKLLAFVFLATPRDTLIHIIPQILEWLVEFINNGGNTLKTYTYFCAQFLFYKTDPYKISIIWPTIVADIMIMFNDIFTKGITTEEYPLLLQMLKFLEIIFILNIDFTIETKWGCIQPQQFRDNEHVSNEFYFTKIYEELKKSINNDVIEINDNDLNIKHKRVMLKNDDYIGSEIFIKKIGTLSLYHQRIDIKVATINENELENDMIDEFLQIEEMK